MTNVFLIVGYLALVVFLFTALSRSSRKVHGKLTEFQHRAENAKTSAELVTIRKELVAYANKECWHRTFTDHAREVLGFINGRIAGIKS